MRLTVFGANGLTGRLLTGQALAAGHDVVAVTRRPDQFPIRHDRLTVFGGDVRQADSVETAVAGADAVLSALGVPFGKEPIDTYSVGVANMVAAMCRNDIRRIAVVSSSAVDPHPYPGAGFLFNRVLQPYIARVLGKTQYDDLRRMESVLTATDLDWTIIRSGGLYALPAVTEYTMVEGRADKRYTARVDLAAALLRLAEDATFVRKIVSVVTTTDNPSLLQLIRTEALG
ncbi:putative NAD(P)-binding protein [Nocardia tenerifensis]|uniref:Putative NAD(P)-binding protein n=1 Tax=Nocardia tenerifensis TaxID=228006 RepID=A0A318JQI1_9NOCA|nr:NAD(P)H-binding protein [Nocardia tenerifensis]PXX56456.1 putative NAD(P)-binding protein [Nocardia tenerifensis]